MKKLLSTLLILGSLGAYATPKAEVAILIDTSGSMQGLINQVRDGLWQTLNNLGVITQEGEVAELKLALYEYGSGVVPAETGFIQQLVPLTTDHTLIAEKLFATKAQGGTEYSGMAIERASSDLRFSTDAFKSIVIAGNETIYQGEVDPLNASAKALASGIIVNSIFAGSETITMTPSCGFGHFCSPGQPSNTDPETKLNPIFKEWIELAENGGGETLNIDQNNSIPHIESPFDEDIVKTTELISETFMPFGEQGQVQYDRMRNLDRQVRNSGSGSYIGWGDYRSGSYGVRSTANWDLVSAKRQGTLKLDEIKDEHLPKELRGKSLDQKMKLITLMDEKRAALEKKATELRIKRKEFVAKELEAMQGEGEKNFAKAIKEILVKQLKSKGFEVKAL